MMQNSSGPGAWILVAGAAAALLASCKTATEFDGALVLAPAKVELNAPANVVYTLHNQTGETVSVPRCGNRVLLAIDAFHGEQWVRFQSGVCVTLAIYVPDILAPGESLTDSVRLDNPAQYRLIATYRTAEGVERYSVSPIVRLTR